MFRQSVVRGLVLVLALSLAGCGGPPEDEIQAAQTAMTEARQAGADKYAPDAYGKAEETLAQANAEVEAQKGRFVLMRSYGRSKQLLRQAAADAGTAKTEAAAGRVQARGEAEATIAAARTALDAAIAAVAGAPAGKDSRGDLAIMKGDLEALKGTLSDAEAAQGSEDYATALERAQKVRQEAEAISADVANALRKTQRS
ncbi:MAG TPA: DUF4398 domain-containing protein [Thermoanaerobaculia bacterium]|nr:DUF4398 domain-containing protein [Thermoanaerobaculia bacterium]